ncbi:hypothetical protein CHELA40_10571 [Chelatococcus asaccharovorans]|nr:hypothetical protein CHELA40_10571 [Chelatococcus asaccharovorans]CAH1686499.1 hypothetical protein CHELA17_65038 [Chelatococcus asaccharovorans]
MRSKNASAAERLCMASFLSCGAQRDRVASIHTGPWIGSYARQAKILGREHAVKHPAFRAGQKCAGPRRSTRPLA